jgi:tripartite-type tricarboxylate transporter receptor subunit TctC
VGGFNFVSWQMIVAPAGTPKPIVDRLHRELKAIIALPEVQQEYVKTGRISVDSPPPEELLQFMRSEIVRLGNVVESAGIARSQ